MGKTKLLNGISGVLGKQIAKGASGTFGINLVNTGIAFLISIILARKLGAAEYGAYVYAISWLGLLTVPALLGMDQLLVRNVANYKTKNAWNSMKGIFIRAFQLSFFSSVVIGATTALIAWVLVTEENVQMVRTLWVSIFILPMFVIMRTCQASLQGLHRIVLGQLPISIIQPVCFLVLISMMWVFDRNFSSLFAVNLYLAASTIATFIAVYLFLNYCPSILKRVVPSYNSRVWMMSIIPLTLISTFQIIFAQAGTIMIGTMLGAKAAGVYAVVNRGAGLIAFILIAVNAALAPMIVKLFTEGDITRLQNVVSRSAIIVTLFALIGVTLFFIFGHWFLLMFGYEFVQGISTLKILCFSQLFNASMGSVGLLLIMTNHEKFMSICMSICTVLHIILNYYLISILGIEGAAISAALSVFILNTALAIHTIRSININPTIFLGKRFKSVFFSF